MIKSDTFHITDHEMFCEIVALYMYVIGKVSKYF